MLKNKKLVKIVVSMLLSVTLVCAMCFQAYAEDRMRYYPKEDTVNNMYYCGIVWSSIDADAVKYFKKSTDTPKSKAAPKLGVLMIPIRLFIT